jgi:hypothetical protein
MKTAGLLFLLLLALALPFDVPVFHWPGTALRLTHLEILLALVGVTALLHGLRAPGGNERWCSLPASWRWLWLAIALAALLAAWTAPAFRWNGFVGAARLWAGMVLALATLQLVDTGRQATWLMGALAAGGLVAAAVGLLEVVAAVPLTWLDLFRSGPTVVGPFLRLSGPFNHANQAAMYLEAMLPLWLAAVICSWQRLRRPHWTAVLLAATLLLAQALLLTLSRAALFIGLFSAVATVVLLSRQEGGGSDRRFRLSLVAVSLALFVVAVQVWTTPALKMRLLSEDDADWYRVRLDAPPEVRLAAGQVATLTVSIRHDGRHAWPVTAHNPIRLGARWYRESDDYRLNVESRWPLPETLKPGESVLLDVPLAVPQTAGHYRVEWDLVQEHVTWFRYKGGTPGVTRACVEPAPSAPGTEVVEELFYAVDPSGPPIPRRRLLWNVAWQQFLVYPLGGIGLDNFRLTYGRFLAWQHWNDTIHTNNWYLEMLVSLGLLGALPFFSWMGLLWHELIATVRRTQATAGQIAVAVALLAYGLHGLVDYFLMDRPTGWLFWLLAGLWLAQKGDQR